MKKFLKIAVVISTCVVLLCCSVFSVFAVSDDRYLESTKDDPNIAYDVYLEELKAQKPALLSVGAAAAGAAAFGASYAAGGATVSGGAFATGILANGGYVENKSDIGIVDISVDYDIPDYAQYEQESETADFYEQVYEKLADEHGEELDTIYNALLAGDSFIVPMTLQEHMCKAINEILGVEFDENGNIIWTPYSIPEEELRVGSSTVSETFTAASANRKWISAQEIECNVEGYVGAVFGTNGYLEWTFYQAPNTSSKESYHIIKNLETGTAIEIWTPFTTGTLNTSMSRWYNCTDSDTGATFWMFGHAYGSNSTQRTVCYKEGISKFRFSNTDTVLDGIIFTGVSYDAANETWQYEYEETVDDEVKKRWTSFPLDPLGVILSHVGGDAPAGGGVAARPNPNAPTDTPVVGPIITHTPTGSETGSKTVATPLTTDIDIDKAAEKEAVKEEVQDGEPVVIDDPNALKDFIAGFWDTITGLFDWLPVEFTDKLNDVMSSLTACLVVFVAVKIIDIIWP